MVDLESIFRTLNEKDELYLGALKLTASTVIGHDDYEGTTSFCIGLCYNNKKKCIGGD